KQRGRRDRAEMWARTRAVGDVDRVGEPLERQRLGQQIVARNRYRRRDFRGDDKAPGAQFFLQIHGVRQSTTRIQWTLQAQQWEKIGIARMTRGNAGWAIRDWHGNRRHP